MKTNLKLFMMSLAMVSMASCQNEKQLETVPGLVVETKAATEISAFSAKAGGSVNGTDEVAERGICWGVTAEPTKEDNVSIDIDAVEGEFELAMTGLTPETDYFVRAYAESEAGEVFYGEAKPFKTATLTQEKESNSYLVLPSSTVVVPVSRANKSELGIQIADGDELTAQLLWMDNLGVVNAVEVFGKGKEASLVVFAGETDGNALVAVKKGEKILWSWHIWVSQAAKDIKTIELPSGALIMDRNLGAITKTPSEIGAVGLQYQFGRKDPFTASATYGNPSEVLKYDLAENNPEMKLAEGPKDLAFAVANPDTFITSQWVDWCDHNEPTWWKNDLGTKTVYDPCPEGWRVPDIEAYTGFAEEHITDVQGGKTFVYKDQNNFWPFSGYREVKGAMDATGNYGTFWVNSILNGENGVASALSPTYGLGGAQAVNGAPKGRALCIRCVKE